MIKEIQKNLRVSFNVFSNSARQLEVHLTIDLQAKKQPKNEKFYLVSHFLPLMDREIRF